MQYCYKKVCINPIKPTTTVGFAVEKQLISETKQDLFMRILYLVQDKKQIIICTLDNLAISFGEYSKFNRIAQNWHNGSLLLVCCSHTHYAPSLANQAPNVVKDIDYYQQVEDQFAEAIRDLPTEEIKGEIAYSYKPFTEVGKARISSNSNENVYAGVLSLFDGKKRIGNLVFYNCHPTEDSKDAPYFSSAYVGATLQRLENDYPNEFFMFLQGADGDVSSRFTRTERSFNQTQIFGELMSNCFSQLMAENKISNPLSLDFRKATYDFIFKIKDEPELSEEFLNSLKPQERDELMVGLNELRRFKSLPFLPVLNTINVNRINLGPYRLVFIPYELFSQYNELIDRSNTLLVCYANGAPAYLLPPGNKEISYEYFIENTSEEDKMKIVQAIKNL